MNAVEQPSVAVVGCGYWGKNLVRNFYQLGALKMVCDASPEAQANAAQIAPNVDLVNNIETVLASDVDAVVLATPAETHFTLATRVLNAEKDVFIEKPLALNYEQGSALVKLAEKRTSILMVGHVLEYHPAITVLLDLVGSGELGKIQYVYSNRVSLGKIRREENILWSFAPHDIAVMLRLIGSLPIQVAAFGGSYIQPNIADVTVTTLLFDNGVRGHLHVSWLHPFKEQRLVVIGAKKMASFDDVGKKLMLYDQRIDLQDGGPIPINGGGEQIEFPNTEPLRLECQAFLESIVTRQPPLTDGYSGLQVLKVLQVAQRSLIMNGEPVAVAAEALL